jgi:hypothetical protein
MYAILATCREADKKSGDWLDPWLESPVHWNREECETFLPWEKIASKEALQRRQGTSSQDGCQ